MMLVVFNRIVLNPLLEDTFEYNIPDLTTKIFEIYLKQELTKVIGEKEEGLMSSENETTSDLSMLSTFQSTINTNKINDKVEESITESDTTSQIEMFIEQLFLLLLDRISNEYSVFFINSTSFPISSHYQILEKKVLSVINNVTKEFIEKRKSSKEVMDILLFYKENDFINNRFVNVTKNKIANTIADIFYLEMKRELIEIFDKFLQEHTQIKNISSQKSKSLRSKLKKCNLP